MQYSTYKNTLQQLAQKIGDVDQEKEEHKCVDTLAASSSLAFSQPNARRMSSEEFQACASLHRSIIIVSSSPPTR